VDDVTLMDAVAQAAAVRNGDISPLELVDAAITRVEKLDGELNAVIHTRFDAAREQAKGELPDGPFRGVPIVFKDLSGAVEGEPCHEGMAFARAAGWRAQHTDALMQGFLDAGFICVGRTNTPEQGLVPTTEPLAYGPTRNPWDTSLTAGGSSGGSAAAVASGMVAIGHASDGGGSIRIPASCCGIVGLKPSRARTTLLPNTSALDDLLVTALCVTRSVRDVAAALDAVAGPVLGDTVMAPPPARPYSDEIGADPGRLRVGLLAHNPRGDTEIHPDCVAAVRDAGALLESLGHTVEESFPAAAGDPVIGHHFTNLWTATLARTMQVWEERLGREITEDDVESLTWSLLEIGRRLAVDDYIASQHAARDLGTAFEVWFASGYDLLLTPTLGEPPPPLGTFQTPDEPFEGFIRAAGFVPYTPMANLTGEPAISLPLYWNDTGLPVGVQLQAPYGREDVLLRVAAQLEQARPWADRHPPLFG
jgi:amidase